MVDDGTVLPEGKISVGNHGYAQFWDKSQRRTLLLHRWMLGLEVGDPREGDHDNFDRLDNRMANLKIVTKRANRQHKQPRKVSQMNTYKTPSGKWQRRVTVNGQRTSAGTFDTFCAAIKAA